MIFALLLAAAGPAVAPPPLADPLTVGIEAADADRFAALFGRTGGKPKVVEGAADFIATLATGRQIDPARAAWAEPREATLWKRFIADLAATRRASGSGVKRGTPSGDASHRWVGDYGGAPWARPGEAGYWIGQRIWERWYARRPDKAAAIRRMLTLDHLDEVLEEGALPAAQQIR